MYREATKAEQAILDYFEENTDVFNDVIEELDTYNGYLGDDRYYCMEDMNDLFSGCDVLYILNRAFFGSDEEGGAFNPNRDYFRFNGYGNFVSAWKKDYSDHLDLYIIDALVDNRENVYTIDDDPDLSDLFDALEAERDDDTEEESR